MKISNQTKIYILTGLLFGFTFMSAMLIFSGLKTNEYNLLAISANVLLAFSMILQIIKLSKIENNK
ncbi:hypothetical protein [Flavobacterium sp.]|jgi:hypothetical protein|uniref:hypothetical protein n=1 Tax=Flavobacterium sp. TaxID=239 RepID=UPI0037C103D8